MIEFIIWIIFGGIIGWIASILTGTEKEQGTLANIIIGILGAFIGGVVARMLGFGGVTGFNLVSLATAVFGAVVLIAIIQIFTRTPRDL